MSRINLIGTTATTIAGIEVIPRVDLHELENLNQPVTLILQLLIAVIGLVKLFKKEKINP